MSSVKTQILKISLKGKIFEVLDESECVTLKIAADAVELIVKSEDKFYLRENIELKDCLLQNNTYDLKLSAE